MRNDNETEASQEKRRKMREQKGMKTSKKINIEGNVKSEEK